MKDIRNQETANSHMRSVQVENLVPHPDHPNRMSKKKFTKLVHNIERTGLYEPLVVRPCPERIGAFQIINGHYRWKALHQLGYQSVEVVVWDIDDEDTDIFLATLNRLNGSDVLEKKLALMDRLNHRKPSSLLTKLLPYRAKQIQRLAQMHTGPIPRIKPTRPVFAHPVVFFLSDTQKEIVEKALSNARGPHNKTRAAKNAAALTFMAQQFNKESSNDVHED